MAEVVLDILLNRVTDHVIPFITAEVDLYRDSEKEVETLVNNLKKIKLRTDDAEKRQLRQPLIMDWLKELQDIAYDVEDALDVWEAKTREPVPTPLMASNSEDMPLLKKVCRGLQSVYSSCKGAVEYRNIALDIKDLNAKLEKCYDSGIREHQLLLSREPLTTKRSEPTIPDFVKSHIHGRETDKDRIKAMLFHDDRKENDTTHVVSLVGQGGLGKTTIAKIVYGDRDVEREFPLRIWVCVSDPFDQIAIAKQILQQLDVSDRDGSSLASLTKKIKESLPNRQKFLLVLDDVWTEDHTQWEPLNACLGLCGAKGSMILVTTRKLNTAKALGSIQVHHLQKMTDGDCWSIIRQIALCRTNDSQLEDLGIEIAKKCDGLPLAAHFMGGLLRNKTSRQEWRGVLESDIWALNDVENQLFRHFFLSYDELDSATKRCFSYCALLPKDFVMDVEKLIRRWMAQGFLGTGDQMEVRGQRIFNDLAQHSFFQDFVKDDIINERVIECKMHDIVHDFAQYLTKNECGVVEGINSDGSVRGSFQSGRHLSWLMKDDPKNVILILNAKKVRTFFCMNMLPSNLLSQLKSVRELTLMDLDLFEIPGEIGNLIHLRYLDLSYNNITSIPQGIWNLCDLETLDLSCNDVTELPQEIVRLVNLRHLLFSSTFFLSHEGLAGLTNLRTLSGFIEQHGSLGLGWLKDLNQLQGNLWIRVMGLADSDGVKKAALEKKKSIQTLVLQCELEITEMLQPNVELQSLHLYGHSLPGWISSMKYLRKLEINYFSCSELPPLWKLKFLEILILFHLSVVEYVGREFLGLKHYNSSSGVVAFPSLKKLEFSGCKSLIEMQDINEEEEGNNESIMIMPRLSQLVFYGCSELEVLPHRLLKQVTSLRIYYCHKLEENYGKRGRFEDKIAHIQNCNLFFGFGYQPKW